MRMQLLPMQFMAMQCTGCGRFLSKPEQAATEDDIDAASPLYPAREDGRSIRRCPKCGRDFKVRKTPRK